MGKRKIIFTASEKELIKPLLLTRKEFCLEKDNLNFTKNAVTIDEVLAKFDEEGRDTFQEKQYKVISTCVNEHYPLDKNKDYYISLSAFDFASLTTDDVKKVKEADLVISINRKIKRLKDGFTFEAAFDSIEKLKTADKACWSSDEKKVTKLAFQCEDEVLVMPLGPSIELAQLVWLKQSDVKLDDFANCADIAEAKKEIAKLPIKTNQKDEAFIKLFLA